MSLITCVGLIYIYIYIYIDIMLYIYSTFIYTYYHIFAICHNTLYLIYVNNIEQLYVVCIYIYTPSITMYHLFDPFSWDSYSCLLPSSAASPYCGASWTTTGTKNAAVDASAMAQRRRVQRAGSWKEYAEIWVYGNHIHGYRWLSMDILYLWYN